MIDESQPFQQWTTGKNTPTGVGYVVSQAMAMGQLTTPVLRAKGKRSEAERRAARGRCTRCGKKPYDCRCR